MSDKRECRASPAPEVPAPELEYLPRDPRFYDPGIGVIGCGGIIPYHLRAYRASGYRVLALCDVTRSKAEQQRRDFYPEAAVGTDYRDLLARPDIDVVDIATHPEDRVAILEDALNAGKHVLSQKPFVLDLADGERLADLADKRGLRLAVNQNGRWAPHFSYMRAVLNAGLIGDVTGAHMTIHWDHNWTADTPFNDLEHLILFDFAIHWFDMLRCIVHQRPVQRVYAAVSTTPHQIARPPLLAEVTVEFDGAIGSLTFHADTRYGAHDQTLIAGHLGTITSAGPDLNAQTVTLFTQAGKATPKLEGEWFTNGFHGAMAELLCAIEEEREPYHSARHNLDSLALCFAAIASSQDHLPKVPWTVRRLPA